jgi:hypothetical protein
VNNLIYKVRITYKIKHTPILQNEADNPFRINKFLSDFSANPPFFKIKLLSPLESSTFRLMGTKIDRASPKKVRRFWVGDVAKLELGRHSAVPCRNQMGRE